MLGVVPVLVDVDNPIYPSPFPMADMTPSLDQFRAFVALSETGQFTRAAERLDVSQSTLSASIQRLEALLGVKLFERHTRGCRLTEAGQALLPSAIRMTQEWAHMEEGASDFARFGRGRLSIAAPTVQCALLLPPLLRRFRADHAGVRIMLHDVPEQQVHDLVRTGAVDLGIATLTEQRTDLIASPFYTDEYVLALPPGHPLLRRKVIEWAQLQEHPIIGPVPGNPVRQHLDSALARHGISLRYEHEVSLPWTMVGMVREGFGAAVLTMAVRPLIDWNGLEMRPLARPVMTRTLVVLRLKGRTLDALSATFRNQLLGRG
jgi:LysR family carnitine catabolism transcriptional activator